VKRAGADLAGAIGLEGLLEAGVVDIPREATDVELELVDGSLRSTAAAAAAAATTAATEAAPTAAAETVAATHAPHIAAFKPGHCSRFLTRKARLPSSMAYYLKCSVN